MISSILILYVWSYFSLFCHEMGHFIFGKLAGVSPYLVKIGMGEQPYKMQFFDAVFEISFALNGGLTYAHELSFDCPNIKLRSLFFTIGGVFANSILLVFLINLLRIPDPSILTIPIALEIISLFRSIIPRDVKINGEIIPNDGKQFISILTANYQDNFKYVLKHYNKQYREQLYRYAVDKEVLPKTFLGNDVKRLQVFIKAETKLNNQNNFKEAVCLFLEVLEFKNISNLEKAFVLDKLACIVTLKGYKKYLNEADKWSQEAIDLASHCKTLKGTRGAILIELGRYDEGKQLLLPLTEPDNEELDIAVSSCYLAKAEYFLGNIDKANAWLVNAKRIGNADANRVLKRIQQEINYSVR